MFQALLRRREARLFFIISILFFICIHSIDAFLAPMMINQGIEPQIMGIIMGASGLATLLIRFPLGIISDVVKSRRIFIQIGLLLPIIAWPIAWLELTPLRCIWRKRQTVSRRRPGCCTTSCSCVTSVATKRLPPSRCWRWQGPSACFSVTVLARC